MPPEQMKSATFLVTNAEMFDRAEHDRMVLRLLGEQSPAVRTPFVFTDSVNSKYPFVDLIYTQPCIKSHPELVLTPNSHIYTLSSKYHLIMLVDVSASMSTIGAVGKPKSLFSVAFETMCKCVDGSIRPFNPVQGNTTIPPFIITPDIYVTVIADNSSTLYEPRQPSGPPFEDKRRPFKVLCQEFLVNKHNFDIFTEGLYESINAFENESVELRRGRNKDLDETYQSDMHHLRKNGSLYGSLEYVLYFLKNSGRDKLRAVVLISDGVASGFANSEEMTAHDYCRRITREFASFTVIQIGCPCGYYPAVNYGHIPDPEYLKFLAVATSGRFLYSTDCHYLHNDLDTQVPGPNFYHTQLLIRHLVLNKSVDENIWQKIHYECVCRSVDTPVWNLSNIKNDSIEELKYASISQYNTVTEERYPWHIETTPPKTSLLLYNLQRYSVFSPALSFTITARLLEGYTLHSVQPIIKPNRKPKVDVIFILPWLAHINIFYRIRCYQSQLTGQSQETGLIKSPRIELNLMAPSTFTILLMNLKSIQSNPLSFAESSKLPMFNSVLKLQQYIQSVYESDVLFKAIWLRKEELSKINPNASAQDEHAMEQSLSLIDQLIESKSLSFEEENIFIILRSTSFTKRNAFSHPATPNLLTQDKPKRQVATIYLLEYLLQWSSFHIGKQVFVKKIENDHGLIHVKLHWECDFVVNLILTFMGLSITHRKRETAHLIKDLNQIEHSSRGIQFRPIIVCQKLVNRYIYEPNCDYLPHLNCFGHAKRWSWFPYEKIEDFGIKKVLESAKALITYHRLSEGFVPIYETPLKTIFYTEFSIAQTFGSDSNPCSALFSIRCDTSSGKMETGFWAEPFHETIQGKSLDAIEPDTLFSQMYTLYFNSASEDIEGRDSTALNNLYTFCILKQYITASQEAETNYQENVGKLSNEMKPLFKLRNLIEEAEIHVMTFRIPSADTSDALQLFLMKSTIEIMDFKFVSTELLEDLKMYIFDDLDAKMDEMGCALAKGIREKHYFSKIINEDTFMIMTLPSDKVDFKNVFFKSYMFVISLPTTSQKTVAQNSVSAFRPSRVKLTEHFSVSEVPTPTDTKFHPHVILSGTYKYDLNQKVTNIKEIVNSLDRAYQKAITQTSYFSLLFGNSIDADYIKNALGRCNEFCINIEISDFLHLTPVDSSDNSFSEAYQEVLETKLKRIFSVGDSTYILHELTDHTFESAFKLAIEPLFLTIEICLTMPDDFTAHFNLSSADDISHIRDNYMNFNSAFLQFKWKSSFPKESKIIDGTQVKNLFAECIEYGISEQRAKHIETLYFSVREFLDEEILHAMLFKDIKSVSLKFLSDMISRLARAKPIINKPSEVLDAISRSANVQTFSARIAPVFLGGFGPGIASFFVNFFLCKCFESTKQVGSSFILKYSRHDELLFPAGIGSTQEAKGLGISNFQFHKKWEELTILPNDQYWLILSNNEIYLDIEFFSRNLDIKSSSVLQILASKIFNAIKKVNQRTLLHDLNESRRASKLLIVKSNGHDDSDDEDDKIFDVGSSNYSAGEFACPEQFSHTFNIHWRLKSTNVLNHIMLNLQPFAISNRQNMLVYTTNKSSYYIELVVRESLVNDAVVSDALNQIEDDVQSTSGELSTIHAVHSSPLYGSSGRKQGELFTPTQTPISTSFKSTAESCITMKVYGVDASEKELQDNLITLIESRISSLLQSILSTFLSRNITIKLTTQDIEFILPIEKKASKIQLLKIPNSIANPYLLLMCLRQNLLGYLSLLSGVDVITLLRRHYEDHYGWSPVVSTSKSHEQRIGDLSFIYSAISTRSPTPVESSFGYGIASICLAVVDNNGKILIKIHGSIRSTNVDHLFHELISKHGSSEYSVLVEVWTTGNINIDNIMRKIETSYNDSLIDYCMEEQLGPIRDTSSSNFTLSLQDISKIFDYATDHTASSFFELKSEVYLPIWVCRIFLAEIKGILLEFSADCQISVYDSAIDELKSEDHEVEFTGFSGILEISATSANIENAGVNLNITESSPLYNFIPPNPSPRLVRAKSIDDSGSECSINSSTVLKAKKINRGLSLAHVNTSGRFVMDSIKIFEGYFDYLDVGLGQRNFIVYVKIEDSYISVRSYNLNKIATDKLFAVFVQSLSWNNLRIKYLKKYNPFNISINIENLSPEREIKPVLSSYYGICDNSKLNQFYIQRQGQRTLSTTSIDLPFELNDNRFACLYSRTSDNMQRAMLEFSLNYIWSIRELLPSLRSKVNTLPSCAVSDSISRTPKTLMRMDPIDIIGDKYTILGTAFISALRSMQILASFKYPLLFTLSRTELFDSDFSNVSDFSEIVEEQRFKSLLEQWHNHFSSYLDSLKFEKLNTTQEALPNFLECSWDTYYKISDSLNLKTDILYFSQRVLDGVLIIQMSIDDIFFSMDVYSLCFHSEERLASGSSPPHDFIMATDMLRKKIHFHSLCYDFHIRAFQQVLEDSRKSDNTMNILEIMHAFVKFNCQRAPFARCRILHQKLQYDNLIQDAAIRTYIFNNPEKYGFTALFYRNQIIGCYMTTSSPLFHQTQSSHSPFLHTLVIYPEDTISTKAVELSCFILLIDTMNLFPDESDHGLLGEHVDEVDEYIHSGYYLLDILKNGVKQVDLMIEKATQSYSRDSLWEKMVNLSHGGGDSFHGQDAKWISILTEKLSMNAKSVIQMYPELVPMFTDSRIKWSSVLNELEKSFKGNVLSFMELELHHLILLNPVNKDYLLHFINGGDDGLVACHAVNREGIFDEIEGEHVDAVVREISACLFRLSINMLQ